MMPAMKQASFGRGILTKRTRKATPLAEMERVVPWAALVERVAPHAPHAHEGRRGRPPFAVVRIAATTNQALAALQVDPAVRPWLKLFLEHNYDNTRRIASGGVQPKLNLGLIRAIRLPLPPANEQRRIVAEVDRRLSIVREVETEVDANLKRAQALRQTVLQRAFAFGETNETMSLA
jgi:hypothetical protein